MRSKRKASDEIPPVHPDPDGVTYLALPSQEASEVMVSANVTKSNQEEIPKTSEEQPHLMPFIGSSNMAFEEIELNDVTVQENPMFAGEIESEL